MSSTKQPLLEVNPALELEFLDPYVDNKTCSRVIIHNVSNSVVGFMVSSPTKQFFSFRPGNGIIHEGSIFPIDVIFTTSENVPSNLEIHIKAAHKPHNGNLLNDSIWQRIPWDSVSTTVLRCNFKNLPACEPNYDCSDEIRNIVCGKYVSTFDLKGMLKASIMLLPKHPAMRDILFDQLKAIFVTKFLKSLKGKQGEEKIPDACETLLNSFIKLVVSMGSSHAQELCRIFSLILCNVTQTLIAAQNLKFTSILEDSHYWLNAPLAPVIMLFLREQFSKHSSWFSSFKEMCGNLGERLAWAIAHTGTSKVCLEQTIFEAVTNFGNPKISHLDLSKEKTALLIVDYYAQTNPCLAEQVFNLFLEELHSVTLGNTSKANSRPENILPFALHIQTISGFLPPFVCSFIMSLVERKELHSTLFELMMKFRHSHPRELAKWDHLILNAIIYSPLLASETFDILLDFSSKSDDMAKKYLFHKFAQRILDLLVKRLASNDAEFDQGCEYLANLGGDKVLLRKMWCIILFKETLFCQPLLITICLLLVSRTQVDIFEPVLNDDFQGAFSPAILNLIQDVFLVTGDMVRGSVSENVATTILLSCQKPHPFLELSVIAQIILSQHCDKLFLNFRKSPLVAEKWLTAFHSMFNVVWCQVPENKISFFPVVGYSQSGSCDITELWLSCVNSLGDFLETILTNNSKHLYVSLAKACFIFVSVIVTGANVKTLPFKAVVDALAERIVVCCVNNCCNNDSEKNDDDLFLKLALCHCLMELSLSRDIPRLSAIRTCTTLEGLTRSLRSGSSHIPCVDAIRTSRLLAFALNKLLKPSANERYNTRLEQIYPYPGLISPTLGEEIPEPLFHLPEQFDTVLENLTTPKIFLDAELGPADWPSLDQLWSQTERCVQAWKVYQSCGEKLLLPLFRMLSWSEGPHLALPHVSRFFTLCLAYLHRKWQRICEQHIKPSTTQPAVDKLDTDMASQICQMLAMLGLLSPPLDAIGESCWPLLTPSGRFVMLGHFWAYVKTNRPIALLIASHASGGLRNAAKILHTFDSDSSEKASRRWDKRFQPRPDKSVTEKPPAPAAVVSDCVLALQKADSNIRALVMLVLKREPQCHSLIPLMTIFDDKSQIDSVLPEDEVGSPPVNLNPFNTKLFLE